MSNFRFRFRGLTGWAAGLLCFVFSQVASGQSSPSPSTPSDGSELQPPVRLTADGQIIDIGKLSSYAHAGPSWGDADGDGDADLLVGDFPGFFWLFENTGTNAEPQFTSRGKLQAGGEDARTPVY